MQRSFVTTTQFPIKDYTHPPTMSGTGGCLNPRSMNLFGAVIWRNSSTKAEVQLGLVLHKLTDFRAGPGSDNSNKPDVGNSTKMHL